MNKLVIILLGLFSLNASAQLTWVDPLTKIEWVFLSHGLEWQDAVDGCKEIGYFLPTRTEVMVAHKRLNLSVVGQEVRRGSCKVWTVTENQDVMPSAWFVYLDTGNAGVEMKMNPKPVVCVRETEPVTP